MTIFTLSSRSSIDFVLPSKAPLFVTSLNNSRPFPFEIVSHFSTTSDTKYFAEDNSAVW